MALPQHQVTGDDRTVQGADRNSIGAHAAVSLDEGRVQPSGPTKELLRTGSA
jgi:hypothetical protein